MNIIWLGFTSLFSYFLFFFFFFNDTATTEIYTLSLHDALPIWWLPRSSKPVRGASLPWRVRFPSASATSGFASRSEEHTSELQSPVHLVCRLLLEKKKLQILPFLPLKKTTRTTYN